MQESVAVTKENIFTQPHANVYNLINNRTNVPDPNDSTGKRKFVYVKEPNFMAVNFAGFPCISVSQDDYSQGDKVASATKAKVIDTIQIIVMTQDKKGDSSGDPSGAAQLDEISNNIIKTLNNLTNSASLRNNGLKNKQFTSAKFDWGELDGKAIFKREFSLRFSQLRVIA